MWDSEINEAWESYSKPFWRDGVKTVYTYNDYYCLGPGCVPEVGEILYFVRNVPPSVHTITSVSGSTFRVSEMSKVFSTTPTGTWELPRYVNVDGIEICGPTLVTSSSTPYTADRQELYDFQLKKCDRRTATVHTIQEEMTIGEPSSWQPVPKLWANETF